MGLFDFGSDQERRARAAHHAKMMAALSAGPPVQSCGSFTAFTLEDLGREASRQQQAQFKIELGDWWSPLKIEPGDWWTPRERKRRRHFDSIDVTEREKTKKKVGEIK